PRATEPAAEEESASFDSTAGGSETILVVEDDDLVREHVEEQLRGFGYRVLAAGNGREALEVFEKESGIDLLFTDIVMPGGMNGKELADAARRVAPDIKVLFTSGYTEDAVVHQGRLDPGIHLLSKPYSQADLKRMTRVALASNTEVPA